AAREAAVDGVAGGLGSASALNHANNIANDAGLTTTTALIAVDGCEDVAGLLDGGMPANYVITPSAGAIAEGDSELCTVGYDDGAGDVDAGEPTGNFTAYGVTP